MVNTVRLTISASYTFSDYKERKFEGKAKQHLLLANKCIACTWQLNFFMVELVCVQTI